MAERRERVEQERQGLDVHSTAICIKNGTHSMCNSEMVKAIGGPWRTYIMSTQRSACNAACLMEDVEIDWQCKF